MKRGKLVLLIIDDDESDLIMIERALRQNGVTDQIECVNSGEKAVAYLNGEGEFSDRARFPFPSLVMTDLKMPGKDGFSVLQFMKQHSQWKMIPVLVFSASGDTDDINRSYSMGASCYLEKPGGPKDLRHLLKLLYDFWKECHIPDVDVTGRQVPTEHLGKLGQRFGPIE